MRSRVSLPLRGSWCRAMRELYHGCSWRGRHGTANAEVARDARRLARLMQNDKSCLLIGSDRKFRWKSERCSSHLPVTHAAGTAMARPHHGETTMSTVPKARLPQLDGGLFLTDGGIETDADLPRRLRAAVLRGVRPAARREKGTRGAARATSRATARSRASRPRLRPGEPDLARQPRLGRQARLLATQALADVNRAGPSRCMARAARRATRRPRSPMVISGCVGPRGDGYDPGQVMSARGGRRPITPSRSACSRDAGADMVSAITMTYADEAIGIARARRRPRACRWSISFTVETDGRLPTGQSAGRGDRGGRRRDRQRRRPTT